MPTATVFESVRRLTAIATRGNPESSDLDAFWHAARLRICGVWSLTRYRSTSPAAACLVPGRRPQGVHARGSWVYSSRGCNGRRTLPNKATVPSAIVPHSGVISSLTWQPPPPSYAAESRD